MMDNLSPIQDVMAGIAAIIIPLAALFTPLFIAEYFKQN